MIDGGQESRNLLGDVQDFKKEEYQKGASYRKDNQIPLSIVSVLH